MTGAQYAAYQHDTVATYAALSVESGSWPAEGALERATAEHAELLPQGVQTPGHHLFTAHDADTEVGLIWFAERPRQLAYVYDLRVREGLRGKGYGESIMLALEARVAQLGLTAVQLHVHGTNTVARSLYGKIGSAETNVVMLKKLGSTPS